MDYQTPIALSGTIRTMQVGFSAAAEDLFREIILDHYRNPRHHTAVDPADITVEASNPICGDELELTAQTKDGAIAAIGCTGQGCSISQASASMLCERLCGAPIHEALALGHQFRNLLVSDTPDLATAEELGDLEALAGVRSYPARVKCALLAWNALLRGLGDPDPHLKEGSA